MKSKHLLLSLLLMALIVPWPAQAQTTVTLGNVESTSSSYHVPYNSLYGYSFVEQLYSAAEIEDAGGAAGTISTIRFYHKPSNTPSALTNHIVVYMKNVNKTSFSDATDYVQVAATDVVFDGDWTIPSATGWVDIVLDEPFAYEGTSDLMVAVHETTSGYSSRYFQTTTTTGAVCTYYHDTYNPDPYNLGSFSGNKAVNANRANIQLDIVFNGTMVCAKPFIAVSDITTSGAILTCTLGSGTYNVQYKAASATVWTDVATNTTDTVFTLSGLTPLTTYDVQAQSVCEDSVSDWRTASFTTTAVSEAVGDAWNDDFEGNTCGWALVNGEIANAWCWGTTANNGGTHALYISNDGGTTNAYTLTSVAMVYATKLLNFTEGKFEFSFDWMANGESTYDYLRVALVPASVTLTAGTNVPSGFSTTAVPTGWIAVDGGSKLNQVTEWQNKAVAVNVPAGNYYLVLAWRNDTSQGNQPPAAVDNVSITKLACAYDVTGLDVDDITTNSATLVWNNSEVGQWQVAYADNASFEHATEVIVSDSTYTMSNLQPATTYYAKVRAYCGGSDFGGWSTDINLLTECVALTSYPYTENFDSYTAASGFLPVCWDRINTGISYYTYPYVNGHNAHSTSNCLYFYLFGSSNISDQYAILPQMENLAGKQITLFAKGYNNQSTFKIGTMTDPDDVTTFTAIATQELTTSYQEFVYYVPATATDNYIAILMERPVASGSVARGVYIDDITIDIAPSCVKPNGLVASNPTAHGATLNWALNDETQTAWDVQVSDSSDFSHVVVFEENVNSHVNYMLTGLNTETHYYVRVRANCGADDGVSEWSNVANFTTTIACPAPTNFAASDVYGYSATLNWEGTSESYNLMYRTAAYTTNFFETFSTNVIPIDWTRYNGLVDGVLADTVTLTTATSGWGMNSYALGAYNMKVNIYGTGCKYWLVSPEVTVNADYCLNFKLALTDYNNANPIEYPTGQADDRFVVLIYADDTWNILREWNNTGSAYVFNTISPTGEDVSIDLSSYVGKTVKVAFYGESTVAGSTSGTEDNDLHIDNVGIGIPVAASAWETLTVDEAPVTLNDLIPETAYEAKLQGNCGDDGLSLETALFFSTIEACPMPANLAVVDSLVTATSAYLKWNGSIDVDNYTVRYRVPEHIEGGIDEAFGTSLPSGWENKVGRLAYVMNDSIELASGSQWVFGSNNGVFDNHARINIYGNSRYGWLITPAVTLTSSTFTFDLALTAYSGTGAASGTCEDDRFVVLITTDNEETWTILREWNNEEGATYVFNNIPTAGENVSIDLSAYVGQKVRIAFYGESTVANNGDNNLHIDNVVLGNPTLIPESEWLTAEATATNITLTGLTPETTYEAQVKSTCSDPEEWSNKVSFTTPELSLTKPIEGYGDGDGKWYLIASPIGNVNPNNVTNLFANEYDLYRFNQEADNEWESFSVHEFALELGKGYLYANSENVTLIFPGDPVEDDTYEVTLANDGHSDFAGWNLVGNPFAQTAYLEGDFSFYTMNENGSELEANTSITSIEPMEGIFVYTETDGETLTFTTAPQAPRKGGVVLNISKAPQAPQKGGVVIDRAIVRFGEGRSLPKFQIRKNSTKLYIPQDDKDYAVVSVGRDGACAASTEIPVNFKAEKNGQYTLTVSESLNSKLLILNYLHLIDNLTGTDIDLLATPSYTFDAKVTDYASRFKLVFSTGDAEGDDNFAYISNGNIIITGTGVLQIIDALGRIVLSEQLSTLNSQLSTLNYAPGVYVLQLINGDEVKTQKIVIN